MRCIICFFLAAIVLVVSACSGADVDNDTQDADSELASLQSLMDMWSDSSYKITYSLRNFDPDTGFATEMRLVEYRSGERLRVDVATPYGEAQTYALPEGVYTCTSAMLNNEPVSMCSEISGEDVQAPSKSLTGIDMERFGMPYLDTVAGEDVVCFESNSTEVCFDDHAHPLRVITHSDTYELSFVAQSIEHEFSDDVFELPSAPDNVWDMFAGFDDEPSVDADGRESITARAIAQENATVCLDIEGALEAVWEEECLRDVAFALDDASVCLVNEASAADLCLVHYAREKGDVSACDNVVGAGTYTRDMCVRFAIA